MICCPEYGQSRDPAQPGYLPATDTGGSSKDHGYEVVWIRVFPPLSFHIKNAITSEGRADAKDLGVDKLAKKPASSFPKRSSASHNEMSYVV